MRKIYLVCIVASLILLTGCATTQPYHPMPSDGAKTYKMGARYGESEGFLVGSFFFVNETQEGFFSIGLPYRYSDYGFYFRNVSDNGEGAKQVVGSITFPRSFWGTYPTDIETDIGTGFLFAIPLKAGRYEFFQYSLRMHNMSVIKTWASRQEFSIPFEISPGEALYIGEVRIFHTFAENLFGLPIPGGGYFRNSDKWKRDKSRLLKNILF